MAAPFLDEWSPAAIIAAHTALRDLLDAAADPARITLHDAADVLLATAVLARPCATIDPVTGAMTFVIATQETDAPADGDIAYGTLRDGDGVGHSSLPPELGDAPVPGKVVVNTTQVFVGGPVQILSAVLEA